MGAGVDEGGTAALDDQVGGVEAFAVEPGVDDVDAVADGVDVGGKGGAHRGILGSAGSAVVPLPGPGRGHVSHSAGVWIGNVTIGMIGSASMA
jgi:hypothetical protein